MSRVDERARLETCHLFAGEDAEDDADVITEDRQSALVALTSPTDGDSD